MKRIIMFLVCMLTLTTLIAKSADWKEIQVIELPQSTIIYYDYTSRGNIHYFIKVKDFTVTVSESNAKKFVNGQVKLELVKWYNVTNGKYKYTTRRKSSENVDLTTVF